MTVQNQNVKNVYRGNGNATVFPFTFAINKEHPEYIHVYITDDGGKAVETTDFTCDMEDMTVTYPKPTSSAPKLSATQRLTIYRVLPYTQNLNLVNQGPFFSEDVEKELDDLEMQIQQVIEYVDRILEDELELNGVMVDSGIVQRILAYLKDAANYVADAKAQADNAHAYSNEAKTAASAAAAIVDIGVDPTLTVTGAAADAMITGNVKFAIDKEIGSIIYAENLDRIEIPLMQGSVSLPSGGHSPFLKRLRSTKFYHFGNGWRKVTMPSNVGFNMYRKDITGNVETCNVTASSNKHIFFYNFSSDYSYVFQCFKLGATTADFLFESVTEPFVVEKCVQTFDVEESKLGVTEIPLEWFNYSLVDYASSVYAINTATMCSKLMKIPKGGFYVYRNPIYKNTNYPYPVWQVKFFRINSDGSLSAATDYPACTANNVGHTDVYYGEPAYYPYAEGVYFAISVRATTSSVDVNSYTDYLKVFAGVLTNCNGRLPNIFPVDIVSTNVGTEDEYVEIQTKNTTNTRRNYRNYGAGVSLQHVNRIIASPKYSLVALVYKVEQNPSTLKMEATLIDNIYSFASTSYSTEVHGVPMLDFTKYEDIDEGYAIIGIIARQERTGEYGDDTVRRKLFSMGGMAEYENVLNNIYVEYKNGIVLTVDNSMPKVIAENLHTLENFKLDKVYGTVFGDSIGQENVQTYEMEKASVYWYIGGNYYYNTPFMNVTPKSYVTAAKNPNSRMYTFKWSDGQYVRGYGANCNKFVCLALGTDHCPSSYFLAHGYKANQMYDVTPFTYDTIDDVLKPGDVIIRELRDLSDFHVMLCTEKVYINGSLFCVNYSEGYPVWAQRNSWINYGYKNPNTEYKIFRFHNLASIQEVNSYAARPHADTIHLLKDKYSLTTDYTVKDIMCDRGDESIYCLSTSHIYLSIADDDLTQIKLYKDGTLYKTLDISNYTVEVQNDLRVIDIASDVNDSGYYTITKGDSETVETSFYVPITQTVAQDGNTVTISNPQDVYSINLRYRINANNHTVTDFLTPEDIVDGKITLPEYDGLTCSLVIVIYKTPYGTYWTASNGYYGVDK